MIEDNYNDDIELLDEPEVVGAIRALEDRGGPRSDACAYRQVPLRKESLSEP